MGIHVGTSIIEGRSTVATLFTDGDYKDSRVFVPLDMTNSGLNSNAPHMLTMRNVRMNMKNWKTVKIADNIKDMPDSVKNAYVRGERCRSGLIVDLVCYDVQFAAELLSSDNNKNKRERNLRVVAENIVAKGRTVKGADIFPHKVPHVVDRGMTPEKMQDIQRSQMKDLTGDPLLPLSKVVGERGELMFIIP